MKIKKLGEWINDPKNSARVHLFLTFFWFIMIMPTIIWWNKSIVWIGIMSCWALVAGHWAAYQGSCSEIASRSEKEDQKKIESEQIEMMKSIINEWVSKQGHDRCWYYPDLFYRLCDVLEIEYQIIGLPERKEFEAGCKRFQSEEYSRDEYIRERSKIQNHGV